MPTGEQLFRQFAELDAAGRRESLTNLLGQFPDFVPDEPERRRPYPSQFHPSIVATPDVCGGSPRLIRTRIPVWSVERMRQFGFPDHEILSDFPSPRAADLVQAWSYADDHREEIEIEIRRNEDEG